MKAIVTGAAGFIGSTLIERLLSLGHDVVGVDAFTDYYDTTLKSKNVQTIMDNSPSTFEMIRADLNECDLSGLLEGAEVIYHQAGQPGVRKSWGSDFGVYTRANVDATQRLLEASKQIPNLRRFVYASSSSVYGNAERYPTIESDRPQPLSPYGVTKLAAEHLCTLYAANFGLPTVSLRYFTVYGPRQRPDMAFNRFIDAAINDRMVSLYGTGEQLRDFTYVDDVVEANILAGTSDCPPGSVFNVAGGSNTSINEVLEIISSLTGRAIRVERTAKALGDVFQTGGLTDAIEAALGWRPSVVLGEGIRRQIDYARVMSGSGVAAP